MTNQQGLVTSVRCGLDTLENQVLDVENILLTQATLTADMEELQPVLKKCQAANRTLLQLKGQADTLEQQVGDIPAVD
ncbi:hypothetical protein [Levilactobacillus enshiensis]|uniref:hypothetical protein n=1 Tax=Levilactobacillus enshiensis TaxID=2590213 RepID=UPI0011798B37|nr:hypothetical protein [Levilactobacillus enshiensis]